MQKDQQKHKEPKKKKLLNPHEFLKYIDVLIDDIAFWRDIKTDFDLIRNSTDISFDQWNIITSDCEDRAKKILNLVMDIAQDNVKIRVVLVGDFSSGKSSIINSLLGEKISPVKITPSTKAVTRFRYSPDKSILMKCGDEWKIIDEEKYKEVVQHQNAKDAKDTEKSYEFEYHYPWEGLVNTILIDTPGFQNAFNEGDSDITSSVINNEADVLFWVCDIQHGAFSKENLSRIEDILKAKKDLPIYLLMNKAESKPTTAWDQIAYCLKKSSNNAIREVIPYSANIVMKLLKEDPALNARILMNEYMEGLFDRSSQNNNFFINHEMTTKRNHTTHTFSLDNAVLTITGTELHFRKSREKVLQILDEISLEKQQIALETLSDIVRDYQECETNTLDILKKIIKKASRKNNVKAMINLCNERKSQIRQVIPDCMLSIVDTTYQMYASKEEVETSFLRANLCFFRFNRNDFTSELKNSFDRIYTAAHIQNQIRESVDKLNEFLDTPYIAVEETRLEYENRVKSAANQIARDICRYLSRYIDNDFLALDEEFSDAKINRFVTSLPQECCDAISQNDYIQDFLKPIDSKFDNLIVHYTGIVNERNTMLKKLTEKINAKKTGMITSPYNNLSSIKTNKEPKLTIDLNKAMSFTKSVFSEVRDLFKRQ